MFLQFNPSEYKPNNNRIILNNHLSNYAIDRFTKDERCFISTKIMFMVLDLI